MVRRRYRQPSLLNRLMFRLSLHPIFNPMLEFPMPMSRRNVFVRTVAAACGDVAGAVAIAAVCAWLIEFAALGLFLSFLAWLVGALVALGLSQYVVHPAINAVLCDRKLDAAVDAIAPLWRQLRSTVARFIPDTAPS